MENFTLHHSRIWTVPTKGLQSSTWLSTGTSVLKGCSFANGYDFNKLLMGPSYVTFSGQIEGELLEGSTSTFIAQHEAILMLTAQI